ncbi:hypothetical protein THIOKS13090002 [Thiocapsa sp. KS1]|nr:hypothetical protein THIOKS13090002 [Thiocapsa sp. KS1]
MKSRALGGCRRSARPIREALATPIAAGATFIRVLIERRGGPRHRGCRCAPRAVLAGPRRGDVVRQRRDPDGGAIWTDRGVFPITNYMDTPPRMRRYMDTRMFFPYGASVALPWGVAKVTLRHFRRPVAGCESHSPTLSPSATERESHSPTLSPHASGRESHSPTLSLGESKPIFNKKRALGVLDRLEFLFRIPSDNV